MLEGNIKDYFTKWVAKRIDRNQNCIIVINGATGSGKTYSAISLAYRLATLFKVNFEIKNNLTFDFKSFIRMTRLEINRAKGTPFIFEEVGAIGGGAMGRQFMSMANKMFFSFMQTTRHKNQILIMTCPSFGDLDIGARSLSHIQITTSFIDYYKKLAFLKINKVNSDPITRQVYFTHLKFYENGIGFKVPFIALPHPKKEIVEEYEVIKKKFTDKLEREILTKVMKK